MGPKRASEGDLQQVTKVPKLEQDSPSSPQSQQHTQNADFSSSVKKRLANSTRTGQACDRCKIRKIRCDGRPDGCSPCAQNRTECKTTDRITGRAKIRGHTEAMETENQYLRAQVSELQTQLKEMGVEPRTVSALAAFPLSNLSWQSSGLGSDIQAWPDGSQRRASDSPLPGYAPASIVGHAEYRPLPPFKMGSIGDNYLGVSSADSLLSHIKGTSLSVFGIEIDMADFVQDELEYDKSIMSYDHFLRVCFNEDQRVEYVPYPDKQALSEYSNWYLRSLNPYTMLLHRPTFMHLIWRIGNEPGFSPSPSEVVCVHMMLATIMYQISVRNNQPDIMEQSHKHYRYSLSFCKVLLHSHTWQDLQALSLICHHMRNFPKPGAAWIAVSTTFSLAVELGLHRSTKAWAESSKMDKLEVEMRKRIFWTLHALATNLSAKLGRPMPLSMDDVDVEFPEPISDGMPGDEIQTPFRQCSFHVGIHTAKYTVWSSELSRTIYAVRADTRGYEDTVRRLENGIRRWREEIPVELSDPSRAEPDHYIYALYLKFWEYEYQLLLHHPAVCRSTDPAYIESNLDKCLEASQKMLVNADEMRKSRSLDIPWISSVVYIAAIFTTLFIHYQRKDQLSSAGMSELRNDMSQWLEVLGEAGKLLGSGDKLQIAVGKIIERSLTTIDNSIVKRTATESLARAALQTPPEQPPQPHYANASDFEHYHDPSAGSSTESTVTVGAAPYTNVPNGSSYTYGNGSSTATIPPSPQTTNSFEPQAYNGGDDAGLAPSHVAALAAAASGAPAQRSNSIYTYPDASVAAHSYAHGYPANGVASADWQQWSRTNIQQPGPPGDYLNTASTLVALGGREAGHQGPPPNASGAMDGSMPAQGSWPYMLFNAGPKGQGGQQ